MYLYVYMNAYFAIFFLRIVSPQKITEPKSMIIFKVLETYFHISKRVNQFISLDIRIWEYQFLQTFTRIVSLII